MKISIHKFYHFHSIKMNLSLINFKIIAFFYSFLFISFPNYTFCNENTQNDKYTIHSPSVGLFISGKIGVNGGSEIPGRSNSFAIGHVPDFGVVFHLPLSHSSSIGSSFEFGFAEYSTKIEGTKINKEFDLSFTYLVMGTNFHLSYFSMGFNFGYPLHGTYGKDIESSNLSALSEFLIGANLPLLIEDSGKLEMFIKAGYMLTGVFKEFGKNDPLKSELPPIPPYIISDSDNLRIFSIQLGLTYLINI